MKFGARILKNLPLLSKKKKKKKQQQQQQQQKTNRQRRVKGSLKQDSCKLHILNNMWIQNSKVY